jgi:hypothetical protein
LDGLDRQNIKSPVGQAVAVADTVAVAVAVAVEDESASTNMES